MNKNTSFATTIIGWYKKYKRDLPWRKTSDPYLIWISEIILQQTRVNQGIGYYYRFISRFPDIKSLFETDEQEVLKYWQGLGYYSRARNLHAAARQIKQEHGGKFPSTYNEIIKLKGIGEYTAAAISSFSFNLPHPVLDGNVKRVISRFFGIQGPVDDRNVTEMVIKKLHSVFDPLNNQDFNQAIMEFGALHCTPANPKCESCVLKHSCKAFELSMVRDIPGKKSKINKRKRYLNYFVFRHEKQVILRKRPAGDIWQHMYDFPLIESKDMKQKVSPEQLNMEGKGSAKYIGSSKWQKHLLTHQIIHARFHEYEIENPTEYLNETTQMVVLNDMSDYPMPKLIAEFIQNT